MGKIVVCSDTLYGYWIDESSLKIRLSKFVHLFLHHHGIANGEIRNILKNRQHPLLIAAIEAERAAGYTPDHSNASNLKVVEYDDEIFDVSYDVAVDACWRSDRDGDYIDSYEVYEYPIFTPKNKREKIAALVQAGDVKGLFAYLDKVGYDKQD